MGNRSATDRGHIPDFRRIPQNFINFDMPRHYLNVGDLVAGDFSKS